MSVSGYYGQVRPLLGPGAFAHVFERYRSAKVHLAVPEGNNLPSDQLRRKAVVDLLTHFEIEFADPAEADVIMVCGTIAGSGIVAGSAAAPAWVPWVQLPRSYLFGTQFVTGQLYSREPLSIARYEPRARLAPDPLMTLQDSGDYGTPGESYGWFFKKRPEWMDASKFGPLAFLSPNTRASDGQSFLGLAAFHSTIITDSIELAIAGLLFRRTVVMVPGEDYVRSFYETWLCNVPGCHWNAMPYE